MSIEAFDRDDEFHRQLGSLNANYGAGDIIGVAFSEKTNRGTPMLGMAVIDLQYGMTSKRFSVEVSEAGYYLKFLGKTRHVLSDYFLEAHHG